MKLFTTNDLGNYITKRLAFLLKEIPEYESKYEENKHNKKRRVKKHIYAYYKTSDVFVYYDYDYREITIRRDFETIYSIMLETDDYISSRYIEKKLEELVNSLPPF